MRRNRNLFNLHMFASLEIKEKRHLGRLAKSPRLMAPLNHEPSKKFFGAIFKMVLSSE